MRWMTISPYNILPFTNIGIIITQFFFYFRNGTLVSFYKKDNYGTFRQELAVNDQGYVVDPASVNAETQNLKTDDYVTEPLDLGTYFICVTNDFRYIETEFSITINAFNIDWRYVSESRDESMNFGNITDTADSELNFGLVSSN